MEVETLEDGADGELSTAAGVISCLALMKQTFRQTERESAEDYYQTPLGNFDCLLGGSATGR